MKIFLSANFQKRIFCSFNFIVWKFNRLTIFGGFIKQTSNYSSKLCRTNFDNKMYISTYLRLKIKLRNYLTFSAKSSGVRPRWSLRVRLAPDSTKTSTLLSCPCSAATCKEVLPSPLGPHTASKSAPAWFCCMNEELLLICLFWTSVYIYQNWKFRIGVRVYLN